jgi:hypothetical protein
MKEGIIPLFTKLEYNFRTATSTSLVTNINVKQLIDDATQDQRLVTLYQAHLEHCDVAEDVSDHFFYSIISTYFMTRCNGLCRQQVEQYRQKMQSSKLAKSLRQNLAQSSS